MMDTCRIKNIVPRCAAFVFMAGYNMKTKEKKGKGGGRNVDINDVFFFLSSAIEHSILIFSEIHF